MAKTSSETIHSAALVVDQVGAGISSGISSYLSNGFISTIVVMGVLIGLRYVFIRLIRGKDELLSEDKRRWIIRVKNMVWTMMVLSIVLIWAPELRTFALSLTAIAVAVVVATKELILCFSGSFMRMSTQPFQVGDWVRLGNVSGEVVDISIFSIVLEEIDHDGKTFGYTGKTISVPNSLLLTAPVENMQVMKRFLFKEFSMTINYADMDVRDLAAHLRVIAARHFEPNQKEALARIRKVERKVGIKLDKPDPEIYVRTTDLGHLVFTVKAFLPTREAHKIATAISSEFLSHVNTLRTQIEQAKQDKADKKDKQSRAEQAPKTKEKPAKKAVSSKQETAKTA